MKAKSFVMESKKHERQEEKALLKLHNAVFEVKKELKKHEKEPMSKAHPKG